MLKYSSIIRQCTTSRPKKYLCSPKMSAGSIRRVALAGLGAIGLQVARTLDSGAIQGYKLAAVAVRDRKKAHDNVSSFRNPPVIVERLEDLTSHADLVVECAPAKLLASIHCDRAVPKILRWISAKHWTLTDSHGSDPTGKRRMLSTFAVQ